MRPPVGPTGPPGGRLALPDEPDDGPTTAGPGRAGAGAGRVVGVLPDVPAVDRVLDYEVPDGWTLADDEGWAGDTAADRPDGGGALLLRPGLIVRVPLQGRRVRGWVVDVGRRPPPGLRLRTLAGLVGCGPSPELVELAGWAARRWAGRPLTFLRAASPARIVRRLPPRRALPARPVVPAATALPAAVGVGFGADADAPAVSPARARDGLPVDGGRGRTPTQAGVIDAALTQPVTVVRLPPAGDELAWVEAALARGQALVLTPGQDGAARLAGRLRRAGHRVARHPEGWAAAATGASVVGCRAAAWMPAPDLASVVVLDEHDPRYRDERRPRWHARDVAVERARRSGVPCLLVSPTPSLEALVAGRLLVPSRTEERAGWPVVEVIDRRRDDDPARQGLYSAALVRAIRGGERVGVVLNRTGRARLLACGACGQLATCSHCGRALAAPDPGRLACPRCALERPAVCEGCGSTRLRLLRPGVSRVREELEALLREPIGEVTAVGAGRAADSGSSSGGPGGLPDGGAVERVVVGTEALLHRVRGLDVVAFVDIDADLCAPRFRAAEQVLGQLALAARLVGGRSGGGRLVVQTRQPDHEVVQAALHADPGRWARVEAGRRRQLHLPPFAALAQLGGAVGADAARAAARVGLAVHGPFEERYLVRAPSPEQLADGLATVAEEMRPAPGALRIDVDPPDV